MKIASWNINSFKARKPVVMKWLESVQPDLVFCQEIKTTGEHGPEDDLEALGYVAEIRGNGGYAGVATLIKKGIEFMRVENDLFQDEEQARYIEIIIGGTHYINIYAPNGNPVTEPKYQYKLNWYSKLEAYLNSLLKAKTPFIIGGDFNIIPEDKDCYDPAAWSGDALFTPEVRDIYRRLSNSGLVEAFRVFDTRADQYTFWDYQAGSWPRGKGIRIDHFFLSPKMADRLDKCWIDAEPRGWEKPSDHTPILVEVV